MVTTVIERALQTLKDANKHPLEEIIRRNQIDALDAMLAIDPMLARRPMSSQARLRHAGPDGHLTPLMLAIDMGRTVMIQRLLPYSDPVAFGPSDTTALMYAAQQGTLATVQQFLPINAVNAQRADGFTALHIAADQGHVDVVHALLAAGANPNLANDQQQLPIHYAVQRFHAPIVVALAPVTHMRFRNASGLDVWESTVRFLRTIVDREGHVLVPLLPYAGEDHLRIDGERCKGLSACRPFMLAWEQQALRCAMEPTQNPNVDRPNPEANITTSGRARI